MCRRIFSQFVVGCLFVGLAAFLHAWVFENESVQNADRTRLVAIEHFASGFKTLNARVVLFASSFAPPLALLTADTKNELSLANHRPRGRRGPAASSA